MRIKTFISTYLLLLVMLFSSLIIVSVYMNNNQTNMLRGQSARDYQRISSSLVRDIAVLYGRSAGLSGIEFSESVNSLMRSYARYYRGHNINISLTDLTQQQLEAPANIEISFVQQEQEYYIRIVGTLSEPFQFYLLTYYLNITESVIGMQNIQHALLTFFVGFSAIAALALYFILLRIFKPLDIVADVSRKIADEHYNERIYLKGSNELAKVAEDFNRMAEKIENQIRMLEEEAAGKQRFIDNFAHEIRTPLTSIYGNAEYMQKAPLEDGEIIELTQSIMNKTDHIKIIANSLLQLATLRNYAPVKTEIDIDRLFENIAQTLKKPLNEYNIQLGYKSSVSVLPGQEDLIKILLLNLCINGLKACSLCGGTITLEAEEQKGSTVLTVTDTGIGIPKESIPKVIEPFYRVDKSRSYSHGGAGLGLTLCKQIVEIHDAEMIIESTVGVGTTVKILFTTS